MSAGGTGQVGHFARNPQAGKMVFQQGFGEGVEFGYGNGGGCEEFGHREGRKKGERLDYKGFQTRSVWERSSENLKSEFSDDLFYTHFKLSQIFQHPFDVAPDTCFDIQKFFLVSGFAQFGNVGLGEALVFAFERVGEGDVADKFFFYQLF